MPENEFEKQVQEIMNGFKLKPSESVWKKVKERIPKGSRSRRFFAFLLLLTGIAISGYFFYLNWDNNYTHLNNTATDKKQSDTKIKYNGDSGSSDIENKISEKQINSKQLTDKKSIDSRQFQPIRDAVIIEKKSVQFTREQISVLNNNNSKNDEKDTISLSQLFITDTLNARSNQIAEDRRIADKEMIDSDFSSSLNGKRLLRFNTYSLKNQLLNKNVAIPAKQSQKLNKGKNWQLGISVSYGKADIVKKFFDENEDKSITQSNSTGGYPPGDTSYYLNASKNVKAKAAFSFGFTLKKPISHKSTLITGVEYLQLNTQIETGSLKDSAANFSYDNTGLVTSVNSFYQAGTTNTHLNTYHLLQIPLIYEYRLNKGREVAIDIDAGLSLTQLISSNALVYDPYHQAYYRNDDLFQKTQVHFIAGTNLQFALSNKTAFNIGPQIQYGLSNLLRNTYTSQRFFTWGLKAMVILKK